MGDLITISSDVRATLQTAFDDLVTEFGKDCELYYPPRMNRCVNCVFDPVGNKSSNRWLNGGPMRFTSGICPMCNGQGRRAEEVTEVIKMSLIWEPKNFIIPVPNVDIRVPFGVIQSRGYIKDIGKIQRASYVVMELPVSPAIRQRYTLRGEPGTPFSIVQARYFVATWERVI